MRAVADTHHLTTSAVSQQMAALERETGAQLIEPEGRRNCVRHCGHEGRRDRTRPHIRTDTYLPLTRISD
jgi:Bacterial regulatory helix-turn-helix protein, lysR family